MNLRKKKEISSVDTTEQRKKLRERFFHKANLREMEGNDANVKTVTDSSSNESQDKIDLSLPPQDPSSDNNSKGLVSSCSINTSNGNSIPGQKTNWRERYFQKSNLSNEVDNDADNMKLSEPCIVEQQNDEQNDANEKSLKETVISVETNCVRNINKDGILETTSTGTGITMRTISTTALRELANKATQRINDDIMDSSSWYDQQQRQEIGKLIDKLSSGNLSNK